MRILAALLLAAALGPAAAAVVSFDGYLPRNGPPAPEPESTALAVVALVGAGLATRRRQPGA